MVIGTKMSSKVAGTATRRARFGAVSVPTPAPPALPAQRRPPYVPYAPQSPHGSFKHIRVSRDAEAEDVIDLGAPRASRRAPSAGSPRPRLRTAYTPNPRLYPGPPGKPRRRSERGGGPNGARRRGGRVFRRPAPNARLYRPAPRRPAPPPAAPRARWPPPAPAARLDTASRAALRLSERRRPPPPCPPCPRRPPPAARRDLPSPRRGPRSPRRAPPSPRPGAAERTPAPADPAARRLVVTLPTAAGGDEPHRYRPASEHFRLRSSDAASGGSTPAARPRRAARPSAMAGDRHSTSPEDRSDGNETLSAPGEFLAEFLSAIMRRQYAEALKYCRLILQYEPHNATARGFYPLLQHKVQGERPDGAEWRRGSSSEEASAHSSGRGRRAARAQEEMEQGADELSRVSGGSSSGSQSSLELDSSDAPAHSSPSLSLSRHTERSDSAASGGRCDSSEPDDNGNAPRAAAGGSSNPPPPLPLPDDVENDNAIAAGETHLKSESAASSLRRLRAQFTCSIK